MLTDRQKKILSRVVEAFATHGEPVSSAAVARAPGIGLSSASIRNVMAQLEEQGVLFQPHTSAGRVPTPAGMRYYVNYLDEQNLLHRHNDPLSIEFEREFSSLGNPIGNAAQRAGELLSRLSSLTSIVSMSGLNHMRLNDIKLSLLSDHRVLVILVAQDARVFHRVVHLSETIDRRLLGQIQNYLSELVDGQTLAQLSQRVRDERRLAQANYLDYVRAALEIGNKVLEDTPGPQLHVEGRLHILEQREFSTDIDRMRELLRALAETEHMVELLDRICETRQSQALIGPELGWDLGDDLSLIICDYYRGDQPMGVVGVLGPIRMNYARVIPLVDYAASVLSRELATNG